MSHDFTHLPKPYPFGKPNETLHVISTYFNPVRFHSRARLFKEFKERVEATPHAKLWIVEVAFGDRPFEMTESCNPQHLQLRTVDELWHKETALNLLVHRLPPDWKYLAWLDGDISYDNKKETWAMDAIHMLQHYKIIQMWDQCHDLDIHGRTMHTHRSAVSSWLGGAPYTRQYGGWHPGFGWGYTRRAWNDLGGLFDYAILGSGDDHMMKALLGKAPADSLPGQIHPHYRQLVAAWANHGQHSIKGDIGFLPATIKHYYHGSKADRKYWSRWTILMGCERVDCRGEKCPDKVRHRPKFDPLVDIKRDWQGLWQLTDRHPHIRDGIRKYMRQRQEDANV